MGCEGVVPVAVLRLSAHAPVSVLRAGERICSAAWNQVSRGRCAGCLRRGRRAGCVMGWPVGWQPAATPLGWRAGHCPGDRLESAPRLLWRLPVCRFSVFTSGSPPLSALSSRRARPAPIVLTSGGEWEGAVGSVRLRPYCSRSCGGALGCLHVETFHARSCPVCSSQDQPAPLHLFTSAPHVLSVNRSALI